jgi:hypothetical protein
MNKQKIQDFPILINRAMAGEESSNGQIDMSIKKASLASDIANAETIHTT